MPIDLSRAFAAVAPQLCKLVEVDDDHALTRTHTLRTIAAEARELFNVAGRETRAGRDDAAAAAERLGDADGREVNPKF